MWRRSRSRSRELAHLQFVLSLPSARSVIRRCQVQQLPDLTSRGPLWAWHWLGTNHLTEPVDTRCYKLVSAIHDQDLSVGWGTDALHGAAETQIVQATEGVASKTRGNGLRGA